MLLKLALIWRTSNELRTCNWSAPTDSDAYRAWSAGYHLESQHSVWVGHCLHLLDLVGGSLVEYGNLWKCNQQHP